MDNKDDVFLVTIKKLKQLIEKLEREAKAKQFHAKVDKKIKTQKMI